MITIKPGTIGLRNGLSWAIAAVGALLAASSVMVSSSHAADTKFAGRSLDLIVGFAPGNATDVQARILAPAIGKILGVNVRVENQPSAGGLVALNNLYARTGDVTRIGFFAGQGVIGSVLGGAPGANFELDKFVYMPQPAPDMRVLTSGKKSGLVTMDDVVKGHDIKDATPGPGASSYVDAIILYHVFGIRGSIVTGFHGAEDAALALIRGDAQLQSATLKSTAPYLKDGTHNLLLVIGDQHLPDYPNVPTVFGMKMSDENEAIMKAHVALGDMGMMIVAAPGAPPDQAKLLQDTFQAVYDDPVVQATYLKTTGDSLTPYNSAAKVKSLVDSLVNAPQQYKDLLRKAFYAH